MYTVGFGDLAATTTLEATYMIFIETISCIFLAYNITSVGNIIRKIRSYDEEKDKNIKTFVRMQ